MDLQLKGKNALITGGSRGIGFAIAAQLASEGANVSICARGAEGVDTALKVLASSGVNTFGKVVDVADGDQLASWIADSAEQLGGVDIFVSNTSAGNAGRGEANWKAHFDIDILGAVRGFEASLPYFDRAGGGSVVFISTTAAVEMFGQPSGYGPMKAALLNYANMLSQAYAAKQIRVNSVSPGPTYFEGGAWANIEKAAPDIFNHIKSQEPMGRLGAPADVANAVTFLASPAAAFITGVNLVVDGGFTKRVNY